MSESKITIENNLFKVNGKQIWFNGANTPWNKWNDFGGGYDDKWWDTHFAELHKAGLNSTRVWINCNSDNGAIAIDETGMIGEITAAHWDDLDKFFETARRNKIYIMATLLSFDHFQDRGERAEAAAKWRSMLYNKKSAESFAEKYVIPFVKRYDSNPYFWSIDLMNEPDWVYEVKICGQIPWENTSYLFAVCSAAIHEHSKIPVTVGMSFPKYNSDRADCEGNKVSDAFLQSLYPNKLAYLDFWSPHYYDWVGQHYGVPFCMTPEEFGMDPSKPSIIAECCAKGSAGKTKDTENNTIVTDYKSAFENGWQGVMPWTSNGVDANGDLSDLSPGTLYMSENHRELIFP